MARKTVSINLRLGKFERWKDSFYMQHHVALATAEAVKRMDWMPVVVR